MKPDLDIEMSFMRYKNFTQLIARLMSFSRAFIVIWLALILVSSSLSLARAQSLALIRDAEIEGLIKDYTKPIFKAAGLGRGAVDVLLINDPKFNAFVTGRLMFINTGAIVAAETPNEIIGVIAHETGHIVGAHQIRMRERIEKAQILGAIGILLGAGAMATGIEGGDEAGAALIHGSRSGLQRSILAYSRDEEASADRAAINLLNKTKQSGRGMIRTFKRFNNTLSFSGSRPDPYKQSHPLPQQRINLLQNLVEESPNYNRKDPAKLQLRHDMARAKIAAYTNGFKQVQQLFKNNLNGAPARYGLAISHYLRGRSAQALKGINKLLKEQPKNAYLYEIKAEILLHAGKADQALKPMRTALKLDPYHSGLLRIIYGQMLLSSKNPGNVKKSITQLQKGLALDPNTVAGYSLLARAYGKTGQIALANAAIAEERFLLGRHKEAKQFARRAQQKLKKNSPQWLRLQDIILYKSKKK